MQIRYDRIDFSAQILLHDVPRDKFNLNIWAEFTDEEEELLRRGRLKPILNGCGTAGCGLGWICSNRSVRREGFTLEYSKKDDWVFPRFKRAKSMNAACLYYGIKLLTAKLLFDPYYYNSFDDRTPDALIYRLELLRDVGEEQFTAMLMMIDDKSDMFEYHRLYKELNKV